MIWDVVASSGGACKNVQSMLAVTEDVEKAIEPERKKRVLGSIPETARVILGEYLARSENEHKTRTKAKTRRRLDTGWGPAGHIVQNQNFPSNA